MPALDAGFSIGGERLTPADAPCPDVWLGSSALGSTAAPPAFRPIWMGVKRRLYDILERDPAPGPGARRVRATILALILVSVLGLVLESIDPVRQTAGNVLFLLELVTIFAFTAEYLARLWCITENPRYAHPIRGRIRWVFTPMALMDLLAILPFYLPFILVDLRSLRLLRVFRLARIAKLGRYSNATALIAAAIRQRRAELLISISFIAMLLLISSSLMYYAEHELQPEAFPSIPAAMWWAIVTLTTVGYGDVVPITPFGRLLAAFTAVLGIAMLALPTAILTSGLMERMADKAREKPAGGRCPHCGGELPPT
jgi:voltage-gated potassium channel